MKHLFKLKKDGKTVGYYRFDKAPYDETVMELQQSRDGGISWQSSIDRITYDEILLYVTADKNGEPVFAGDKVNYKPEFLGWITGIIKWQDKLACYVVEWNNGTQVSYDGSKNIELIKDDEYELRTNSI